MAVIASDLIVVVVFEDMVDSILAMLVAIAFVHLLGADVCALVNIAVGGVDLLEQVFHSWLVRIVVCILAATANIVGCAAHLNSPCKSYVKKSLMNS